MNQPVDDLPPGSTADAVDVARRGRPLVGALAGGGALLAIMLVLAGLAIASGAIAPDETGRINLTPWLVLAAVGGSFASVVAGAMSQRIAQSYRGPLLLALSALTVGLLEASELLRHIAGGRVSAPPLLILLGPFAMTAGVLLGGWFSGRRVLHPPAVGWIAILPVFLIGYAVAAVTLPKQHHTVLETMRLMLVPIEIGVVVYLLVLARRTFAHGPRTDGDFVTRLRSAARNTLGSRIPADILTTEVSLFYYALRRPRSLPGHPASFTVHRQGGYSAVVIGLLMALAVETVAVHLLVRQWSTIAAWILTGLSLYGCIWLIGDYRAMVARPLRVTASHLLLRVGMRWEADIPRASIGNVQLLGTLPDGPPRGALVAAPVGQPNIRIELVRPVEAVGLYGMRRVVQEIRLTVDGAEALCGELRGALPH